MSRSKKALLAFQKHKSITPTADNVTGNNRRNNEFAKIKGLVYLRQYFHLIIISAQDLTQSLTPFFMLQKPG